MCTGSKQVELTHSEKARKAFEGEMALKDESQLTRWRGRHGTLTFVLQWGNPCERARLKAGRPGGGHLAGWH